MVGLGAAGGIDAVDRVLEASWEVNVLDMPHQVALGILGDCSTDLE